MARIKSDELKPVLLTHMTVSAIVPARNEEATIAAAVESLAAQPEITEIIVINDQSTDGTAAQLAAAIFALPAIARSRNAGIARRMGGEELRGLAGRGAGDGDWLLFTDADGVHLPGSTARALADAAATGAGLVSYSPEQETRTWWERALIPFVYTRLAQKYSYAAVNDPESPAAAASGQYLLIRREDYERIGGHAAVAGEVLEDVALARLAKQAGMRLHFASGHGIMRVRMYRTFGAMWQGWTKNLYPLMGGTPRGSRAAGTFRRDPVDPFAATFADAAASNSGVRSALCCWRGATRPMPPTLRRNRFPAALALYYLPGVALYAAALLASEWRYARGSVTWKGREYPVT